MKERQFDSGLLLDIRAKQKQKNSVGGGTFILLMQPTCSLTRAGWICYLLTFKKRACGISNMIQKRKAVQKPFISHCTLTAQTFDPCGAETSSTSVYNHRHGSRKSTTIATAKNTLLLKKRRKKVSGPPPPPHPLPPPPQQHVPTWLTVDSQNVLDTLSQTKGEGK